MSTTTGKKASFSISSIIAVVAAIFSFKVGAIAGLLLAGVAIFFGLIGLVMALSPNTRGGISSILAILAGGIGVIAAVIKAFIYFFG